MGCRTGRRFNEFTDLCTFSEVNTCGALPATREFQAMLKSLHPAQILNIELKMFLYKVSYSYFTVRHNYRKSTKYFFANPYDVDIYLKVDIALRDWVEQENKSRPYRAISNVEILDLECVAYANLKIGP